MKVLRFDQTGPPLVLANRLPETVAMELVKALESAPRNKGRVFVSMED